MLRLVLTCFSRPLAVYVICRHGYESQEAVKILAKKYNNVYNIKGGIDAWAKMDMRIPEY